MQDSTRYSLVEENLRDLSLLAHLVHGVEIQQEFWEFYGFFQKFEHSSIQCALLNKSHYNTNFVIGNNEEVGDMEMWRIGRSFCLLDSKCGNMLQRAELYCCTSI